MSANEQSEIPKWEVAVRCPNCSREALCLTEGIFEKIEAVVSCKSCAYRQKRIVNWPADAFYRTEVCNDVLWGWSREHFASIRDFIASKKRVAHKSIGPYGWAHCRLPAHFLDAKRRAAVIRAIERVLKQT